MVLSALMCWYTSRACARPPPPPRAQPFFCFPDTTTPSAGGRAVRGEGGTGDVGFGFRFGFGGPILRRTRTPPGGARWRPRHGAHRARSWRRGPTHGAWAERRECRGTSEGGGGWGVRRPPPEVEEGGGGGSVDRDHSSVATLSSAGGPEGPPKQGTGTLMPPPPPTNDGVPGPPRRTDFKGHAIVTWAVRGRGGIGGVRSPEAILGGLRPRAV